MDGSMSHEHVCTIYNCGCAISCRHARRARTRTRKFSHACALSLVQAKLDQQKAARQAAIEEAAARQAAARQQSSGGSMMVTPGKPAPPPARAPPMRPPPPAKKAAVRPPPPARKAAAAAAPPPPAKKPAAPAPPARQGSMFGNLLGSIGGGKAPAAPEPVQKDVGKLKYADQIGQPFPKSWANGNQYKLGGAVSIGSLVGVTRSDGSVKFGQVVGKAGGNKWEVCVVTTRDGVPQSSRAEEAATLLVVQAAGLTGVAAFGETPERVEPLDADGAVSIICVHDEGECVCSMYIMITLLEQTTRVQPLDASVYTS